MSLLRIKELEDQLARRDARIAELEQEVQRLKAFTCWSNDDGDSWLDHPADAEFVDGLSLNAEFELLAGFNCQRVTYRVIKVPDDENDEYEVEEVQ